MTGTTFQIPNTHLAAGTTAIPFTDVTSSVTGDTSCTLAMDFSQWLATDQISAGIVFRVDGQTVVNGPSMTTTGGTHISPMTGQVELPSCGGPIPSFTTKLEAAASITVPSAHNTSGSLTVQ